MNLAQVMRDRAARMQNRDSEVMDYWNRLVALIGKYSDEGETHMINPFSKIVPASTFLDPKVEKELIRKLEAEGMRIIQHPEPDPGHPCSRPYTELSWR